MRLVYINWRKPRYAVHALLVLCRLVNIGFAEFGIVLCLVDFAGVPRHKEEAFPAMPLSLHWKLDSEKAEAGVNSVEIPPSLVELVQTGLGKLELQLFQALPSLGHVDGDKWMDKASYL